MIKKIVACLRVDLGVNVKLRKNNSNFAFAFEMYGFLTTHVVILLELEQTLKKILD